MSSGVYTTHLDEGWIPQGSLSRLATQGPFCERLPEVALSRQLAWSGGFSACIRHAAEWETSSGCFALRAVPGFAGR